MTSLSAPVPAHLLAWAMTVVFIAGIVRGFAGFGFSALCIAGLALVLPPALVVPPIFVLEVLASISLLRGAWPQADWAWLRPLLVGNALCIPLGVALLAWLPEGPLRVLIGALLLAAAGAARLGWVVNLQPTARLRFGAGLVSGVFNGVAAIGGTALAVLLNTTAMPPAAMRATMIVLFLFTDLYALAVAAWMPLGHAGGELFGLQSLRWAAWLLLPMLAGIALGHRGFAGVAPERFRAIVLDALLVIAALGLARGLFA
ncbi:MAG: sulfite exporter TauE/SafE family protein [Rubrivivax sp.]|nr:sulfite exporter TauE/SafE family protein [Rubrivivax sp.]